MITNYTTSGTVSSVFAKLLRGQRIAQQHGDGHRANASGYGRDKPGVFPRPVEVHISGQPAAIQPRDTDVHDDGAFFDPIPGNQSGLADSDAKYVGTTDVAFQINAETVADGRGRSGEQHFQCQWAANMIGRTYNDGM